MNQVHYNIWQLTREWNGRMRMEHIRLRPCQWLNGSIWMEWDCQLCSHITWLHVDTVQPPPQLTSHSLYSNQTPIPSTSLPPSLPQALLFLFLSHRIIWLWLVNQHTVLTWDQPLLSIVLPFLGSLVTYRVPGLDQGLGIGPLTSNLPFSYLEVINKAWSIIIIYIPSLTSISVPQRLSMKQHKEPLGPQRQNTTLPTASPDPMLN